MSTQRKSVLGRGLNALIPKAQLKEVSIQPDDVGTDQGGSGVTARIRIEDVLPNPLQPRAQFDQQALTELARSILEKGVVQPVTVRRLAEGYQMIAGERRLRAARIAGLDHIPAYIISVQSDEEMLELALIENIQREMLNPMEIAHAYQRLMDDCHLTQDDIGEKVGKDRTTVTNFLRLLKLPPQIQDGLRMEKLSMGHARALINVPNEALQLKLYEKIMTNGLSVRKVEQLVRSAGKVVRTLRKATERPVSDSSIQSVEEKLKRALATKVTVRPRDKQRGEIIIEYYSLDDLDRIIDLISSSQRYH